MRAVSTRARSSARPTPFDRCAGATPIPISGASALTNPYEWTSCVHRRNHAAPHLAPSAEVATSARSPERPQPAKTFANSGCSRKRFRGGRAALTSQKNASNSISSRNASSDASLARICIPITVESRSSFGLTMRSGAPPSALREPGALRRDRAEAFDEGGPPPATQAHDSKLLGDQFGRSCRTAAAVRSTPMRECRKARAAIHRVDFSLRVLVVASQLKRFVPCDGCRIEKATSRRAASGYERARFPGVRSRRLMFGRTARRSGSRTLV